MVYILVGILCVVIIALCIKIHLLKKSACEIAEQFADIPETDTNTLITVSSRDKTMLRLADIVNKQLRILRKERLQYEQGNSELKTAVTNISHDLRTPLTAICGYLDIMKPLEKSEKLDRYLLIIGERTETMKKLCEELFQYSVIMSKENASDTEPIAVNKVLEDCIMGYYAALRERNITPIVKLTEESVMRNCSKTDLMRIFSNLLNNALKYSGGDLEISLDSSGTVVFSNTAPNLDSVETAKLFDRFYTVRTAGNSTGLGLSIAKALCEDMNGKIYARYDDGRIYVTVEL